MIQIKITYQQNKSLGLFREYTQRETFANWVNPNSTTNLQFDRGYTDHQMLDEFDIIDMNGRIYDPIIARFFSPDPGACPDERSDRRMQAPTNTQSFNRYSYVMNNTLIYTDPSGELVQFMVPMLIGAAIGYEIGGAAASGWKQWNPLVYHKNDKTRSGALIGAMVGAGTGLGLAAGLSNKNCMKGFYPRDVQIDGASTTMFYDISVNSLITANTNIVSNYLQKRNIHKIAISGVSGLIAGGIGGGIGGRISSWNGYFDNGAINTTNYISGSLNGAFDRFSLSLYRKESLEQAFINSSFGAGEGFYSAFLGRKVSNSRWMQASSTYGGRYISSVTTSILTSWSGAGVTLASYHASYLLVTSGDPSNYFFALLAPNAGWITHRFIYTSSLINPLFFIEKNP